MTRAGWTFFSILCGRLFELPMKIPTIHDKAYVDEKANHSE